VHRTPTRRRRLVALVAVLGLLAVGCGGDDDEGGSSGSGSGSSASGSSGDGSGAGDGVTETTATTGAEPAPGDVLASAGDAVAAQGAGLAEPPGPDDRQPFEGFGEVAIAIHNPDGTVKGWCVLLAETPEQRQQGLMEVTDFGGYEGMLFVWAEDSSSGFWMRNTPTPLSIAFVDGDGALVSSTDMDPCADSPDCPTYAAEGPYRFALEVPKGRLERLGLVEGATMRVGGGCST
jgi:uncharacterized membrane protein (UPF0127 family)